MPTLTVTAKGQVTLRKDLLQHLGVQPGDKVAVEKLPDGQIRVAAARTGKISDVFDMFDFSDGPHFSIEEIGELAAKGWAGEL